MPAPKHPKYDEAHALLAEGKDPVDVAKALGVSKERANAWAYDLRLKAEAPARTLTKHEAIKQIKAMLLQGKGVPEIIKALGVTQGQVKGARERMQKSGELPPPGTPPASAGASPGPAAASTQADTQAPPPPAADLPQDAPAGAEDGPASFLVRNTPDLRAHRLMARIRHLAKSTSLPDARIVRAILLAGLPLVENNPLLILQAGGER